MTTLSSLAKMYLQRDASPVGLTFDSFQRQISHEEVYAKLQEYSDGQEYQAQSDNAISPGSAPTAEFATPPDSATTSRSTTPPFPHPLYPLEFWREHARDKLNRLQRGADTDLRSSIPSWEYWRTEAAFWALKVEEDPGIPKDWRKEAEFWRATFESSWTSRAEMTNPLYWKSWILEHKGKCVGWALDTRYEISDVEYWRCEHAHYSEILTAPIEQAVLLRPSPSRAEDLDGVTCETRNLSGKESYAEADSVDQAKDARHIAPPSLTSRFDELVRQRRNHPPPRRSARLKAKAKIAESEPSLAEVMPQGDTRGVLLPKLRQSARKARIAKTQHPTRTSLIHKHPPKVSRRKNSKVYWYCLYSLFEKLASYCWTDPDPEAIEVQDLVLARIGDFQYLSFGGMVTSRIASPTGVRGLIRRL